jgi:hypothetical protein
MVWKLGMKLTGMDQVQGFQQPQPQGIPPIGLELLSETKTFRLIDGVISGSSAGNSMSVRVQIANQDEPVAIQAPNPALVDDQGGFGFGLGGGAEQCVNPDGSPCEVINSVGSQVSPEPPQP